MSNVKIPAYRGKSDLTGKDEFGIIEVPESIIGTWQPVESLEKSGIDVIINFGHKTSTMVYVDCTLGIVGRESAKHLVDKGFTLESALYTVRRKQAMTTISGQLCNPRCDFPSDRLVAQMKHWNFTNTDLQTYAASVHKLAALMLRLNRPEYKSAMLYKPADPE